MTALPTYGVVGSQTYSGTRFQYPRYITLAAVDLPIYRQREQVAFVWKTTITSSGSSSDLRRVFPVMVAAAEASVASNTGQQVKVVLTESDKRVKVVKGLMKEAEAAGDGGDTTLGEQPGRR